MANKKILKQVLLVDDDEEVFFVIHESLKKIGSDFEISTAENGLIALEKINETFFDLVITDIKMPRMNGIQLTEAIRKLSPETQVIWMTAFMNEDIKTKSKGLGVSNYFSKPFDIMNFRKIIVDKLASITQKQNIKESNMSFKVNHITERIEQLKNDTGAYSVLLLTASGNLVSSIGMTKELDQGVFSALIQGNIQVANEISEKLGDKSNFKLSYLESDQHNVYVYGIGLDYVLVIVFGNQTSKGIVWFYTEKAANELKKMLTSIDIKIEKKQNQPYVFSENVENELDNILDEFWETSSQNSKPKKKKSKKRNPKSI